MEGFTDGLVVKNLPANAGDMGSISGLGRSPGEGNGQHSCLGHAMFRGVFSPLGHKDPVMTE